MNSKFFVPLETAKLLKGKGLSQKIERMYFDGRITFRNNIGIERMNLLGIVAAPTYHEVVDWLEGKGIYLSCYTPTRRQDVGQYTAAVFDSNTNYWGTCKEVYHTREEALNAAILKALEML